MVMQRNHFILVIVFIRVSEAAMHPWKYIWKRSFHGTGAV